jgi:putative peptidoglycan lipid II flippase
MIKKLFSGQISSITVAALLVAMSSLVSRFLGIFRDRILAGEFGAGDTLDVYYAAFRVPDLIFNLLVLGALSAGFVPILTGLIKDQECRRGWLFNKCPNKDVWKVASNVLNILALTILALSLVGIIFAPALMKIVVPGFTPEKQALTACMTRIMFLSPVFLGISSVLGGILQSFKRFFVYSLSPILYNIGIIIGAIYFVPIWGIKALAWGVVFGAFLHMLVQVPTIWYLGFKYRPRIDFKDKEIRKIGIMMVPRTLTLAITQINLLVITILASMLASGSLTVFNFANNLQSFPIGIFGISFAVAAFPTFSTLAFDKKKLIENFSRVFRQIIFFIIPSTVLLFTLKAQIIRVILGTGEFGWTDTILTINTLEMFAISLFAQASLPLLIRVFYARHDSKSPFLIGLLSAVINVFLSWYLGKKMGVSGLALGFSIASIINFVALWIVLRIEIGNLDEYRVLVSTVKFGAAAILCGFTIQVMKISVWPFIDMTRFWGVLVQGVVAGIIGLGIYIVICTFLRSEELIHFWEATKRRLPWKKVDAGDHGEARGI